MWFDKFSPNGAGGEWAGAEQGRGAEKGTEQGKTSASIDLRQSRDEETFEANGGALN